jgi:hypothetical protein
MPRKITEYAGATIFGLMIMYLSYLFRSAAPSLFKLRIDWQAEFLAIAILALCGVLSLSYKRYHIFIGLISSYFIFYLIFLIFISIACNQGSCL